jgi:hypothetical protein
VGVALVPKNYRTGRHFSLSALQASSSVFSPSSYTFLPVQVDVQADAM